MTFRPEEQVLLTCARVHLEADDRARLHGLLAAPLDWDYLLIQARRHGVRPLLYHHLRDWETVVPPPVLDRLRATLQMNSVWNLHLTTKLIEVCQVLEEHGVTALPFKGPALAVGAYGNAGLREQLDLDILVRKSDVDRVRDIMFKHGYEHGYQWSEQQEKAIGRSRCETVFVDKKTGTVVDVHWAVVPPHFCKGLDGDTLIARSGKLPVLSQDLRALSPEDEILVLAIHGGKHAWSQLKWLCDLSETLRRHKVVNWPMLSERAEELGLRRLLGLGVHLAQRLLRSPLQTELRMTEADERTIRNLEGQVCQNLFACHPENQKALVDEMFFHLRSRERWRDRARHIVYLAVIPTEEDARLWPLPTSLSLIQRFLRPVRLVARYGQSWALRRTGSQAMIAKRPTP